MQFNNGCWLHKEGTECFSPAQIYFSKVTPKEVSILAPTHFIAHRGDTLGGVNLTVKVTSPMPEVFRIQVYHYAGVQKKTPEFELEPMEDQEIQSWETDDALWVQSGNLKIEFKKWGWNMTYYRGDEKITTCNGRDLAYLKTDWRGLAYDDGGLHDTYMRQQHTINVGETFYGLGERFTPFVKNGQAVDMWNEDPGTSTSMAYKNIPFVISNRGYGIFVNHPEKVSFEVGSELVKKVAFSVPGERLDYYFIDGPEMKDVLVRYTDITGKPSLPAPWTFGLWLSTSFTTNYDEATVNSFVDGMFERGIPLKVFHFDCFWMKDFSWSDFLWDSRVFPDPEGMLARLKAKGLKICVWINSYIAQESALFAEGCEKGYFIKRKNGDVWQWDMWQPGMAIVDFTNPEAWKWFQDKLEALLDMGVDCFKTDFGERIPTDCVYYDGSDPVKMHNYYTYLYNKCVYELLERKRGKGEAVLFARSATVGGQKFPVHWGGDCWSDYESMSESLRGGLSLTLSGFGYWSHDIGGFEHTSTPDVYKRWTAFGLLSSHSRFHGSTSYRVPWVYDDEAVAVARTFSELKVSLMPYLYRNAIETSKTGIPMMRAMVLEYPHDPSCQYLDRQYMLGDSLLVSPIFNDEGIGQFYLPEGTWTDYLTGEVKVGGKWYSEKYDYFHLPLMVKENSCVAVGAKNDDAEYDYADGVSLKFYALVDETPCETVVYSGSNELELSAKAVKSGNTITVEVDAKKAFQVVLVNVTNVATILGGTAEVVGNDTVIKMTAGKAVVTLK